MVTLMVNQQTVSIVCEAANSACEIGSSCSVTLLACVAYPQVCCRTAFKPQHGGNPEARVSKGQCTQVTRVQPTLQANFYNVTGASIYMKLPGSSDQSVTCPSLFVPVVKSFIWPLSVALLLTRCI